MNNLKLDNKTNTGAFLKIDNDSSAIAINEKNADNVFFKIIDDVGEDNILQKDEHINISNIKNIVG